MTVGGRRSARSAARACSATSGLRATRSGSGSARSTATPASGRRSTPSSPRRRRGSSFRTTGCRATTRPRPSERSGAAGNPGYDGRARGLSAEAAGARTLFDCHTWPGCTRNARFERSRSPIRGVQMHAILRRYEGVDQARSDEMAEKVTASLLPRLSELPGFGGYYLIDAGDGVITSISLFENPPEAEESTRLVSQWVREQGLGAALPNAPTITNGRIIASKNAAPLAAAL